MEHSIIIMEIAEQSYLSTKDRERRRRRLPSRSGEESFLQELEETARVKLKTLYPNVNDILAKEYPAQSIDKQLTVSIRYGIHVLKHSYPYGLPLERLKYLLMAQIMQHE
jgi:hypothetical protein